LPSAPAGQVLEVGLLYLPSEAPVQTDMDGDAPVVCVGRLADSRQVLLVGAAHPDRIFENQTKKLREMAEQFWLAGIPPSTLDDRVRLIAQFNLEGVRGFTDMAASSLNKGSIASRASQ
jgi:hypothetical protein